MCSIFGVVGEYDRCRAESATQTISHRGEDGSSSYIDESIYLHFNRLAITDIDRDTQIERFEDISILFNGEIYNYKELAKDRDDICEARAIYEAYIRYGVEFISHLRGMYAVAIITPDEVILARDLFGKKPLYYTFDSGSLIFASEPRAIIAYRGTKRLDRKLFSQLLFFQSVIPPNSFYPDIRQLAPSEVLVYDRGSDSLKSHFPYTPINRSRYIDDSKRAIRDIDERLFDSVKLRIPQEVKWGCLLSGGLDSSLVSAVATKIVGRVDTFTIGYEGYEKYDERGYAQIVSKHIDSNHHEYIMGIDEFVKSLNELIEHLDEPLLDPAAIPLWYMMKQIKTEGFKTILSGDGSDELFMGYRLYREYFDIEKASELRYKNWLRNYFKANFSMNKEWERYKRVFSDRLLFRSMAELYTDLQLNRLLKLNVADDSSLQHIEPIYQRFKDSGGEDKRDWYSYCDINTLLSELFLKKLDRVSMAHAIEARSPFLDKELVEYIFSVEPSLRLSSGIKTLLKEVASPYLPQEIIDRKKKGFSYPFIEWLKISGELDKIYEAQRRYGIFRDEALDELIKRSGKQSRFKHHIYALYFLSAWLLRHFE